jgi:hypothetical protein
MFINDIFENDDMFAGSERVPQQIRQDRHPLRDYLDYDDYENLMDEFDDAILHTQTEEEIEEYLAALRSAAIDSHFYDIIENYIMGIRTGVKAENDEKLHYNLNDAFRRTWTEKKPQITVRYLIRAMSRACVAAIHAAGDENEDDVYESEDDMFAASDRASKIKAVIIAGHEEFLTQKKIKQKIIDYCRDHKLIILGTARDAYLLEIYVRAPAASELIGLVVPLEELADQQDMNVTMINGFWDLRTKKPFIAESEDDMFAPSRFQKWVDAIKDILDYEYNHYSQEYNNPDNEGELTFIGERMSDYDHLRSELQRAGVKGFLHGLDMVDRDVIDQIDAVLGVKYKIYLSDIEQAFFPENFNESEDDEMFASPLHERIGIALQQLAKELRQYQNSEQSAWYCNNLGNIFCSKGLDKGVWAWRAYRPSSREGGIDITVQHVIKERTGFDIADYYLDLMSRRGRDDELDESDDDMFSTNRTLAQRIGDAFIDRGESDLDWADTLTGDERHGDYAHELKLRGVKFIETGKAFNDRGIQAGLMELMLIDHEARQQFYNFMKEVEGWDIEQTIQQLIGGLNESEDDGLFAKTPAEKFVDGLRAYQNTIEQDIAQQHPSWADHPHTVEQRRILTRVQILIEQISNQQTMLQGLNLLAKYINSSNGGWTSDIEEFLLDNKFPTIYDMLTRYSDRLDESADEMFSEPRNVASFDKFFNKFVPDASEDLLDDFAGYLYDLETPEAIDKINERIPDNIMITHARWDDDKDDWYFTFKRL